MIMFKSAAAAINTIIMATLVALTHASPTAVRTQMQRTKRMLIKPLSIQTALFLRIVLRKRSKPHSLVRQVFMPIRLRCHNTKHHLMPKEEKIVAHTMPLNQTKKIDQIMPQNKVAVLEEP